MLWHRNVRALVIAGCVCLGLGLPTLAEEVPADNGAVVIMYHRFGEDGYASTNIRIDQFEAHIDELTSGRYNVLPLPELVDALARGRRLPDRSLAITIDDAFLSVYTQAWPRLRRAGLPFTLFVATAPVDGGYPGYMSWSQLREMLDAGGVTIGAHGVNHRSMLKRSAAVIRDEISRGRSRIRERLGVAPELFAYPFGDYGKALRDLVEGMGFSAAFGQYSGAIGRTSDRYALPRFALNEAYGDPKRFILVANALPIPAVDITPIDPLLGPANNPPPYGFTVLEGVGGLAPIACYAVGATLSVELLGSRRVEVRLPDAFKPGRSRINCTLPGPEGRWRWLGRQFHVPAD